MNCFSLCLCVLCGEKSENLMTLFQRWRIFQKVAVGVLLLFSSIMVFAVIKAYSRVSGSTGMDMSKVQKIRSEAIAEKP